MVDPPLSSPVEYYVEVSYYVGSTKMTINSGWITGTSWDFAANANTSHSWRVKARETVDNRRESNWSQNPTFFIYWIGGTCTFKGPNYCYEDTDHNGNDF